jgi:hypothetical protein
MGAVFGKKEQSVSETVDQLNPDEEKGKNLRLTERQNWVLVFQPNPSKSTSEGASTYTKKWKRKKEVDEKITVRLRILRTELEEDRGLVNLFLKIEAMISPTALMLPSYYYLQYDLPKSPFSINVRLDNHDEVMAAYDKFAEMDKMAFSKLAFKILPKECDAKVFRVGKPKQIKVKLDNRNAINR